MSLRHVRLLVPLLFASTLSLFGQAVKPPESELDRLTFAKPELRVSQTLIDSEELREDLPNQGALQLFRQRYGDKWRFLIDRRTGRVNLVHGGAIPFFQRNAAGQSPDRSPAGVESLAQAFLGQNQDVFQISPTELVVDRAGTAPAGSSIHNVRFQWVHSGVPVEGGSIFLIVNNGNLIQIGSQNIAGIDVNPKPTISLEQAWEAVRAYAGMTPRDRIVKQGSLSFIPITRKGIDPDTNDVPFGRMMDYALVYRLAFERPGAVGVWEALVDAHTGELLRFRDSEIYGHVQGGVYKTDAPQTEVTASFGKADYGMGVFANASGDFPAVSGTSTMFGLTTGAAGNAGGVRIDDNCGSISQAANGVGLIDFGGSGGTDCTTPGFGGAGNTHAARTQYWNVTEIKNKAITYLPANTWLQGQLLDVVNFPSACNAGWSPTLLRVRFFRTGTVAADAFGPFSQTCGNTGELPGISLHEWGHGMDQLDGSGTGTDPDNIPVETRADWTAVLQTHQSCVGSGFATARSPLPAFGLNCVGYGNPCTGCTGIRDLDFMTRTTPTAWTPQNQGTVYTCSPGDYNGPCGWEDHCESGIASQALWDFVNRDLVAAPTSLDLVTAWQVADRLFYTGAPASTSMYTCSGSPAVSDGCGAGSLYTVMRAVDDDGDGVANGTPHAAAIFAALDRHGIACGAAGDAANQNQTSCPALTTPVVASTANSHQVMLSWTDGGASATRYFVYRNETGCDQGFAKIATVMAPGTSYTDDTVVHGVTYNYRIQAATANDACVSAMSNCTTATATLAADRDFYVRDWTSTPASFDNGVEPSTNPVFWATSDVWNKGTDTAGSPNASGSYDTDNMFAGAGALGNNFAFVRVHRNTSGSPATVFAHFLKSPFGTGSAYVDASAAADPTITFGAADTVQVIASGFPWHQDEVMSTHACLAVQIWTSDDPFIAPGLIGQTPGPGDYLVLNDNNKAQRNLDVSVNVPHFAGMGFALVHNSSLYPRDVNLQYVLPSGAQLTDSEIVVVGGEKRPFRSGDTVTLKGMQPGENRWLSLRHVTPTEDPVPVHFQDLDGGGPVNGFTILAQPVSVDEAIKRNLRDHTQVFNRLAAAFNARGGRAEAGAARKLAEAGPTPDKYLTFLRQHVSPMRVVLQPLVRRNDPFGTMKSLDSIAAAANGNQADRAASEHGMLLSRLDSFATMLQKADGDLADIPQMVLWQEALYRTRPGLQRLSCSARVVAESQAFIRAYDPRKPEAYRDLLASLNDCYVKTVLGVPRNKLGVEKAKAAMFVKGIFSSSAKLQQAHRKYLLALQEAVGPVQP
jgi:hypothetical protein